MYLPLYIYTTLCIHYSINMHSQVHSRVQFQPTHCEGVASPTKSTSKHITSVSNELCDPTPDIYNSDAPLAPTKNVSQRPDAPATLATNLHNLDALPFVTMDMRQQPKALSSLVAYLYNCDAPHPLRDNIPRHQPPLHQICEIAMHRPPLQRM